MAITLTRTTQTLDEDTGLVTPVTSTIVGAAVKVRGDVARYRELGLVLQTMPTLFFTPNTYGDTPQVGDTLEWPEVGDIYTVRDVETIAPDGVTIAARLVIGK